MKDKVSTIRDIAAAAGVSTTTVSDIMSGRGDRFLKETTDRVLSVATELNYRRHIGASAMRSKRFNSLALILSLSPDQEGLLIEGVEETAAKRNVGLMLVRVAPNAEDLPTVVKNFQVDGLIADWTVSRILSEAIGRYRVPTIWVNNDQQEATDCVWPDDVASGRVATEHLVALGHRDIVFIRVPQASHLSQPMRIAGYEQAMARAGLRPRIVECQCVDAPRDERRGSEYFMRRYSHPELWPALESGPMPTAFVAYNTLTAMEFYAACQRRWFSVAGHFAVVSCDEILEHAEKAYPAISTVVIDHAEMGRRAVDMLMERIGNGGKPVPSQVVPVRLIQRESSTGPMPPT